jgi:hypothetical protein
MKKPHNDDFNFLKNRSQKREWFEDDDDWKKLAKKVKADASRETPGQATSTDTPEERVEVNIKLSLPKFETEKFTEKARGITAKASSLYKQHKPKMFAYKYVVIAIVIVPLVGFIGFRLYQKNHSTVAEVQGASDTQSPEGKDVVLSDKKLFDIVLPRGRDIPQDKIFFDQKRKFARYDDDINGIKVSVSQQPLPEEFKNDPDGNIKNVAENFNAKEKLTFDEQSMYLGQSEEGQQTLILTKKSVMIFIVTASQIDKEALKLYAANLG